jgi:hypothetical protein
VDFFSRESPTVSFTPFATHATLYFYYVCTQNKVENFYL